MEQITPLKKIAAPFGQEIELQQVAYESGGIPLLRVRIRERSRFTIFEIDGATAAQWGQAMLDWAQTQPGGPEQ